jgi:hypothetical protein
MSTFGLKLRALRSVPTWPTVLALARTLGVSCEEFPDVATALRGPRRKPAATSPRAKRNR